MSHRLSRLFQPAKRTNCVLRSLVLVCMCVSTGVDAEPASVNRVGLASDELEPTFCTAFDSTSILTGNPSCGGGRESGEPGYIAADARDRKGLRRDTWYFLGYQVATIGLLYAMPEGVSGWTAEQKAGYSMSIWWDNVTHPQIDSDDFYINYMLHPYWGAAYFVRARERGYNDIESFWYSALLSSAYEFGAEALFEEPSIQDIIVTPIGGALVGMYFMDVRENIREREIARGHRTRKDQWLWVLTDPLGSLNRGVDKLFGRKTDLQIRPYRRFRQYDTGMPSDTELWIEDSVYGIELRLQW